MTEEERNLIGYALTAIDDALHALAYLNLPAAVWDLQAARRRIEEAREKADG